MNIKNCKCRKPNPRLILKAANDFNINLKNSYMVGDQDTDILAGRSAGCKTVLLKSGYTTKVEPDYSF